MNAKIVLLLLLSSLGFSAQELQPLPLDSAEVKKNIIKTNVTAYVFRNVNLYYERSINRWFSINVGFGMVTEGSIPFVNSFLKEKDRKDFESIKIKLSNFTLEPRFYLGKGYGKGFYIAPYYRYSSFSTNSFTFNFDYFNATTQTNTTIPLQSSGETSANSAGLMFGAQFFLNKSHTFVLDWWIGGGHYGSGSGDFSFTSNRTLNADEQQQLKSEIEKLDSSFLKYKVETNANGAKVIVDGPWAGLRSGLALGYRF